MQVQQFAFLAMSYFFCKSQKEVNELLCDTSGCIKTQDCDALNSLAFDFLVDKVLHFILGPLDLLVFHAHYLVVVDDKASSELWNFVTDVLCRKNSQS